MGLLKVWERSGRRLRGDRCRPRRKPFSAPRFAVRSRFSAAAFRMCLPCCSRCLMENGLCRPAARIGALPPASVLA